MKDTFLLTEKIKTLWNPIPKVIFIRCCITFAISSILASRRNDLPKKEAEHDLQIALWVSYACNNIDEYEYYYTSVRWLADVEDLAQGCGVWFYRYSSALMYCGRLTEALVYAEKASWKNLIIRGAGCSWQNCAAILEIRKAHCQRTMQD